MKRYLLSTVLAATALFTCIAATAQEEKQKEKSKSKLGEYDEIIIKRKGDKDSKVTVEIKNGEVTVNGKPIDEYEDDNLSVRKNRISRYNLVSPSSPFRSGTWNYDGDNLIFDDRGFLGVVTDQGEGGAKITSVTENSAAAKAGLKKGDVITKVDGEDIDNPEDLTKAIRSHKPDETVTITYKRDGKENKVTAALGKRKSVGAYEPLTRDFNFDFDHDFGGELGQVFSYGGRGRLGIKAQDTDDGKGVKVLEVAEGSAAEKAGIKKDDIITEFEGETVNSADELAEAAREAKEKSIFKVKFNRGGSSQTVEVKIPKKLKTANL